MPSIALSRAIHCDMIAATYDWVKRIACDHSGTLIFFDWLLAFLWLCTMFFLMIIYACLLMSNLPCTNPMCPVDPTPQCLLMQQVPLVNPSGSQNPTGACT